MTREVIITTDSGQKLRGVILSVKFDVGITQVEIWGHNIADIQPVPKPVKKSFWESIPGTPVEWAVLLAIIIVSLLTYWQSR